jgi:CheY-like chemotaxis protein
LHVYSEKGHGATFNVYLPASEEKFKENTKGQAPDVMLGSEKVLLVDDEKIILEVGGEMLKELGYDVILANSGSEAVEIYRSQGKEIELVILDMIMPDMDGGETYDQLRELDPEVKVLLASGYSMTSRVKNILNRGFNGFIQKPFNMIRLSKKIRGILQT